MTYWETEGRTTLTPTLSRQREREFSHGLYIWQFLNHLTVIVIFFETTGGLCGI